jgi:hypothetical protein
MHTFEEALALGKFRYVLCGLCEVIVHGSENVDLFFKALVALRRLPEGKIEKKPWRFFFALALERDKFRRLSLALRGLCVYPNCDFFLRTLIRDAHRCGAFLLICGAAKVLGTKALTQAERQKLCSALEQLGDSSEAQMMAQKMLQEKWEDNELRQTLWKSAVGRKNF